MSVTFCSRADAVAGHDLGNLAAWHVVSINDCAIQRPSLTRVAGVYFADFADVPNGEDCAAGLEDLQAILAFCRAAGPDSKIVVHCWAGLARSPAVAWIVEYDRLLSRLPPRRAAGEAMANILEGRIGAMPNAWVMLLGLMAVHDDFNVALPLLQDFAARPFMSEGIWQRWYLTWKFKMPALVS